MSKCQPLGMGDTAMRRRPNIPWRALFLKQNQLMAVGDVFANAKLKFGGSRRVVVREILTNDIHVGFFAAFRSANRVGTPLRRGYWRISNTLPCVGRRGKTG